MKTSALICAVSSCLLGLVVSMSGCVKAKTGLFGDKDSYSDSQLRSVKGVQISTSGYETTFRIPWTQTLSSDRNIMFDTMVNAYSEALKDLKEDLAKKKADVRGLEKLDAITNQNAKVRTAVEKLLVDMNSSDQFNGKMSTLSANSSQQTYSDIEKTNMLQSYLVPQGLVIYVGTNIKSARSGQKGVGLNVGLLYVVQAFVTVTIDNHSKQEKMGANGKPKRGYSVDGSLYFFPNPTINFTTAATATAAYQVGVGAVWGPLNSPHELKNYAGVTADFDTTSKVKGWHLRLMMFGKFRRPPIVMVFAGNQIKFGASSSVSGTVGGTFLLDPTGFIGWILGGMKPEDVQNADAAAALAKKTIPADSGLENVSFSAAEPPRP